ncbi:MAG: hypothetical protein QM650_16240 [Microlunatus sp.]
MATWEDGPEYAPLERPDAFDAPAANPSDLAPPPADPAQPLAPLERPLFADPSQPVPELAQLVPVPPAQRDPSEPFDVVSSVVTADSSAWAAAHWSPPAQPYPLTPPPAQPYPPANASFPAPGTPQWFVPGPGYQQPPTAPVAPTARTVLAAATPGVLITLAIGGLIWILAPVTVVVAYLLAGRMTYGRTPTRATFGAVLGLLGAIGLLALVTADGLFSQWWDTVAGWACFGSWVLIAAAVISAYRALRQGRPDPPPGSRRPRR